MSDQGLIRVTAMEDDPIVLRTNGDGTKVRNLSHRQIMKFCAHMINVLARVPDTKMELNSICSADDSTHQISTEHTCGSTFCVFGWMLAEKTGAEMLGLFPKCALNELNSGNDFDAENADGDRISFMSAFMYGEREYCADFMFSGSYLDDFEVPAKVEGLARLAVVYDLARECESAGTISPFQTDKFSPCDGHYTWNQLFISGDAQKVPDILRELLPFDRELHSSIRNEWDLLLDAYLDGRLATLADGYGEEDE